MSYELKKLIRFRAHEQLDGTFVVDFFMLWRDEVVREVYQSEEELWQILPKKFKELRELDLTQD